MLLIMVVAFTPMSQTSKEFPSAAIELVWPNNALFTKPCCRTESPFPLTSRFVPRDLSYPDDSYPGSDVSYPLSISSYPTLWSIRTQQIMTQNV